VRLRRVLQQAQAWFAPNGRRAFVLQRLELVLAELDGDPQFSTAAAKCLDDLDFALAQLSHQVWRCGRALIRDSRVERPPIGAVNNSVSAFDVLVTEYARDLSDTATYAIDQSRTLLAEQCAQLRF
jgi:hypothetical protein